LVGTMIELPRAALVADKIAEVAQFFSFGTNDLTQTTMGISRDFGDLVGDQRGAR
jgi:pyruvate, orthophosphate dikinase